MTRPPRNKDLQTPSGPEGSSGTQSFLCAVDSLIGVNPVVRAGVAFQNRVHDL